MKRGVRTALQGVVECLVELKKGEKVLYIRRNALRYGPNKGRHFCSQARVL